MLFVLVLDLKTTKFGDSKPPRNNDMVVDPRGLTIYSKLT